MKEFLEVYLVIQFVLHLVFINMWVVRALLGRFFQ